MTLIDRLKAACPAQWEAFTDHQFVRQLGEGTLPLSAFQEYLVQDYLFLIQFARANALAAYKARTLDEIRAAQAGLAGIISETDLHVALTGRWGISPAELNAAQEKQATVAYTRYVLDCGMVGDLLDLNVALAPCNIGYAEIGRALAPQLAQRPDHPYAEWIAEYAGDEFQGLADASITHIDDLADGELSERRFQELVNIFRTAARLEADFWQQALSTVVPQARSTH